jgi:hypothetical protein
VRALEKTNMTNEWTELTDDKLSLALLRKVSKDRALRAIFATLVRNRIIVMNKTAFDISTGDR